MLVLASKGGVLDLDPASIVKKSRLQPGRMLLVDTAAGTLVEDKDINAALCWIRNRDGQCSQ